MEEKKKSFLKVIICIVCLGIGLALGISTHSFDLKMISSVLTIHSVSIIQLIIMI